MHQKERVSALMNYGERVWAGPSDLEHQLMHRGLQQVGLCCGHLPTALHAGRLRLKHLADIWHPSIVCGGQLLTCFKFATACSS